jgi:[lysine-biosynthesis-protein LysW]--L-2-aminoadipate ligase
MSSIGVAYDILRWEERAIIESLKGLGAEPEIIHLKSIFIEPFTGSSPDVVLQRSISHYVAEESSAMLEASGVRVVNRSYAIRTANDKVLTHAALVKAGVPTPKTGIAFTPEKTLDLAAEIGYPVVIKPVSGSWGRMVAIARDEEELRALLEHRSYLPGVDSRVFLIQEYIRKPGRDIRAFFVGGEVPAAIYRISDHWITNTARGGRASAVAIDDELLEVTIKAAEAVGTEIAGVDVLEDPSRGFLVNEVNPVPEFKNTVRATGVRLQEHIAKYLLNQARR